jgi:hypothetical protein
MFIVDLMCACKQVLPASSKDDASERVDDEERQCVLRAAQEEHDGVCIVAVVTMVTCVFVSCKRCSCVGCNGHLRCRFRCQQCAC